MKICLFEDTGYAALYPLTYLHPVFELRCGLFTSLERLQHAVGSDMLLQTRESLLDVTRERHPAIEVNPDPAPDVLYLNARAVLTTDEMSRVASLHPDIVLISGNTPVAFHARHTDAYSIRDGVLHFNHENIDQSHIEKIACVVVSRPWDLIRLNLEILNNDTAFLPPEIHPTANVSVNAVLEPRNAIRIEAGARIDAGVVLDASRGSIVIGNNAHVMANTVIIGPVYVGPGSLVKAGAKIYEGTTIGPMCKVGGEIEESIVQGYSNKQHDGFLGHSYLGEWVNLGADTNTSDLKNNYGPVRMSTGDAQEDTGLRFLGLIAADHVKAGINSMFNTGTCIGVGANIFGGGYPPKFIPAFSWGGSDGFKEYELKRFLQTASIVMKRRGKELTAAEAGLLSSVFHATSESRKAAINR